MLASVLLVAVLGATGIAAQLPAALASPDSTAAAAASTASQAANVTGASNAAGASSSARSLYVYGDGIRPLVEETNGVQTLNIYGPGGQIIAQVEPDGSGGQEVRYLLSDHLGSTRAVLDADGNAVARFEYGPYGETTAAGTAAAEVRYRYTGHPYDEAQGVYETPGRGYDPTTGRFLSPDPAHTGASPYLYAGLNPVAYLDPSGNAYVPFFMMSGFEVSSGRRSESALAQSIPTTMGGFHGQRVFRAERLFNFTDGSTAGSEFEQYGATIIRSKVDWRTVRAQHGDTVYWLIGDETPAVEGPTDAAEVFRAWRGLRRGIAENIVLIDLTGGLNRSQPIQASLDQARIDYTLVQTSMHTELSWANKRTFMGFTSEDGTKHDRLEFGSYVERAVRRSRELEKTFSDIDQHLRSQESQQSLSDFDRVLSRIDDRGRSTVGTLGPDTSGGIGPGPSTSAGSTGSTNTLGVSGSQLTPDETGLIDQFEPLPSGPPITTLDPYVGD